MAAGGSWTRSLFVGLWNILNFSRKLFFNVIFIGIVIFIIATISGDDKKLGVTPDSMLYMPLKGRLVIQEKEIPPFEKFVQEVFDEEEDQPEVLVRNVVMVLENAAQDDRIKGVVMNLQQLQSGGLDKLRTIAHAITQFKQSGKPIYAVGDYFTRDQYYLAAHTDEIFLHPQGGVILDGYGRFGLYLKSFLDKLKVSTHVFRVGTYKSAVEPFIRDDMSQEAREANAAWLNAYWSQYKQDVSNARNVDIEQFDEQLEVLLTKLRDVNGDMAQYALDNGWVDQLLTREQVRERMAEYVDSRESKLGYAVTTYNTYLSVINPNLPPMPSKDDSIAIVVAAGTILDGEQKGGTIGGDSTARLLRKARLDDTIKAVVLRVDSPGGSAFASEIIRQEILNLRQAGKPVVAQMGSYAASGGYWISSSTDYIVASPSTITGSIGVFGLFTTYENSLDYLGIHSDGVASTELADFSPARPLSDGFRDIFQISVEHTYSEFINMVAEDRQLPVERVDEIAQGRVWIGEQALDLGLVDALGELDLAVEKAAELAQLESYKTRYIKRSLSAQEMFWKEFFGQAIAPVVKMGFAQQQSPLMSNIKKVINEFSLFQRLNDPRGVYVLCMQCQMR